MKKLFCILAMVVLIIQLPAQDKKFGIRAGVNMSNLDVSPENDPPAPGSRLGIHLGGFGMFELSEGIIFQPEVLFSSQGANDEDPETFQTVKLSYLNLAGLFKYQLESGISIHAGPQLGLLVDGEFEEEDKVSGEQDIFDAKSVYKGTDLALNFGISYMLEGGLELGVRYNLGISDNNDDPFENAFYDLNQELKSRVLQVSVAYILGQ